MNRIAGVLIALLLLGGGGYAAYKYFVLHEPVLPASWTEPSAPRTAAPAPAPAASEPSAPGTPTTGAGAPGAMELPPVSVPAAPVDVDALIARLPKELHVTYRAKSTDASGMTVVEGVEITNEEDPDTKVTVARLTLSAIDIEAFERVFDYERYTSNDETFRLLIGTLIAEDFAVTPAAQQPPAVSIERLEIDGLEMKPFAFKPGGPDFETQFKPDSDSRGFQILGMVLDATKLGAFDMQGLHIEIPDVMLTYDIGHGRLDGINRGRFGKMRVENIATRTLMPGMGEFTSSYEWEECEGFDISGSVPYLMKAEMPPASATNLIWIGAMTARNFKSDLPGFGRYDFSEVTSEPVTFDWLIPSSLRMRAKGLLTIDPAASPDMAQAAQELGRAEFPLEFALDWRYEGGPGNAQLNQFLLAIDGFYGVDFGFSVSGLALSKIAGGEDALATMGNDIVFNGAKLTVTDRGGTPFLLEMYAKDMGATPEQAAQQIKLQFQAMATDPAAQAIAKAVADFIDKPGTLMIAMIPPVPVTAMMFEAASDDPNKLVQILGLTAEAR